MEVSTREKRIGVMLEKFIVLFSEHGMDKTTIRQLAESVELNPALLYVYFANKDDIIGKCTQYHHEGIQIEIAAITEKYVGDLELLPFKLLDYIDVKIDTCRFLLQVMAHPEYSCYMVSTNKKVNNIIFGNAEIFKKFYNMNDELAYGLTFLINSCINDYVLKKSKDQFLIQFGFLTKNIDN